MDSLLQPAQINILKQNQKDFIQRLKCCDLLKEGQHSELIVISGDRLKRLRDFCWEMANKYKFTPHSTVREIFDNNMKGKLGEEVVKSYLGDFISEVDYKKYIGGDGKVDFTLTSNSSIGIQVKTRYGNTDSAEWTIRREEIENSGVLICILGQDNFSDIQTEYNLVIAGFLPTQNIKLEDDRASIKIDKLLYFRGLKDYLNSLSQINPKDANFPGKSHKVLDARWVLEGTIMEIPLSRYASFFKYLNNTF